MNKLYTYLVTYTNSVGSVRRTSADIYAENGLRARVGIRDQFEACGFIVNEIEKVKPV